ncbi:MAG: hypothetical protein IKF19_06305 [Bacilli bacterium]|nr:hypothetical protein [Bacilli bacterium]
MYKNILIIGAARSGKTTLAKRIVKEKGYSLISIDDIVSGFEAFPELEIHHHGNAVETSKRLAPFLIKYLTELSEGSTFYGGIKSVIEGTHFDFEQLIPFLQSDKYKEKYQIIGLTFNDITKKQLYDYIKKYDTADDWTYWCNDKELKDNVKNFVDRNKYFNEMFKKYGITTFDTSFNREKVLSDIINNLEELENG